MAITQKFNLPSVLGDEAKRYRELFEKGNNRTAAGSVSFTSATSGTTYNSTSGEAGIFAQLQNALEDYNIDKNWIDSVVTEISKINKLEDSWRWTLIQTYDIAGTYTWTAPDIDNGNDYTIGVFIMGGGGSGGASKRTGDSGFVGACGGAAGYTRYIIQNISSGSSFPVVVGSGGNPVTTSTSALSSVSGISGGSSSFNSFTANGGGGGGTLSQAANMTASTVGASGSTGSSSIFTSASTNIPPSAPIYGSIAYIETQDVRNSMCSPIQALNPFDFSLWGAAGGYGNGATMQGTQQSAALLYDGTSAGNGKYQSINGSIFSDNATGIGCGGGGCALGFNSSTTSGVATSGAGKSGIVMIYARRLFS